MRMSAVHHLSFDSSGGTRAKWGEQMEKKTDNAYETHFYAATYTHIQH